MVILTDQGKSFENNLIRELYELAQVKKLHNSPYHPETNGQCEHFNATLINMLGTLQYVLMLKRIGRSQLLHKHMPTIVLFLQ